MQLLITKVNGSVNTGAIFNIRLSQEWFETDEAWEKVVEAVEKHYASHAAESKAYTQSDIAPNTLYRFCHMPSVLGTLVFEASEGEQGFYPMAWVSRYSPSKTFTRFTGKNRESFIIKTRRRMLKDIKEHTVVTGIKLP